MQHRQPPSLLQKRTLDTAALGSLKPDVLGTAAILAFIIAGLAMIAYLTAFR